MSVEEKKTEMMEYVAKMVEQMSPEDIAAMLAEFDPAMVARIRTADLPDPGPEVQPGEGAVVEMEDLPVYERIIPGRNNLLPVHFLEEGAVVQRPVCLVNVPGRWRGTGFMVSRNLMLTNNHVLPSAAIAATAEAQFNFQMTYTGTALAMDVFTLNPTAVFRTNAALDYTLVSVRPKRIWIVATPAARAGGEAYQMIGYEYTPGPDGPDLPPGIPGIPPGFPDGPTLPDLPDVPDIPPHFPFPLYTYAGQKYGSLRLRRTITYVLDSFVNVIQHPAGRRKEVALQDNNISNVFANVIRYTSDTEPGSSGSPVFDNNWDLLALHHAAGELGPDGIWRSNEGIRIDSIAADLISHFSAAAGGAAVLAELGLA